MIRRHLVKTAMLVAFSAVLGMGSEAVACPNCKFANETESNLPKAYMYSILFMIGMPATIFTGFGVSFYRMTKKVELEALRQMEAENTIAENSAFDNTDTN